MFVGHALLAFAIAVALASRHLSERRDVLLVALLAGGFATLPDVDVLHPFVSVALAPVSLLEAADAFWAASTVMHRAATHSLVVGGVLAVGASFAAVGRRRWHSGAGVLALGALVWTVYAVSGGLAATVVGVEVAGALGLAVLGRRYGVAPRWLLVAALIGLLSHPFGDLVTGQPPPFLYPLGVDLVAERVTLHADPTVHVLGAFFVELAAVWVGLVAAVRLQGWRLRRQVHPRAVFGAGYGVAVVAVPAPTLDAASPFVFSVLAVGLLGVPVRLGDQVPAHWRGLTTALTAVTVAALAYLVGYLVL
ncbi:metal-dependent hydrolase [Halobacteriales archaeon Cl-PHB]